MNYEFPPKDKAYSFLQTNRSDDLGSLWSTMNLDFQSNLGTIRLAPRLRTNSTTTDLANMSGPPVAFKRFFNTMWTIAGTRAFRSTGNTPNATFTEDTSTAAQTDYSSLYSDIEIFDGRIFATTVDALYSKSDTGTNTWTSRDTLSNNTNHQLEYFFKFDRLYYTDAGNKVRSINVDNVVAVPGTDDYALALQSEGLDNEICLTSIVSTSDFIWLGFLTDSPYGSPKGGVFQWDGISQQPTQLYPIKNASGVMAMCVMDNIPYCMDSNGILSQYTGTSFEEVGRLPTNATLLKNVGDTTNNRFIHPNGLLPTKNGTILALVNNEYEDNGATIGENFPSGVWEWSPEINFTHKYSFTYTPATGSTITDFGQNRVSAVGGLSDMNWASSDSARNGTIMLGATIFTNASSSVSGIYFDDSNDTVQKKGYFVTTWFNSLEIQDNWERLWSTYRRFLNSSDSIVFKYRLNEADPTYASITWVDTTSFTTTTDVSGYWSTGTGGEVEIIQGTGSGVCAHITSVVNNGGTYTVTIDTVATGVTTGTAKARFQHWIKLNPEITGQINSYEQMAISGNAQFPVTANTRIQLKCCMTFTGNDEFHKMVLVSNEDITITK